ncbi:MAG: hypothetical protein ACQEQF_01645 [Bacillota bacterium]
MKVRKLENIIEVKINEDDKKYMFIYKNRDKANDEKDFFKNKVKDNEDIEKYLERVDYKVILDKEILKLINETTLRTPPIYEMALKTGVSQLVIIN